MTVAIITAGYDGTVDETQLAEMFYRYSVLGPEDFKATTQAGDRIVAIADGVALGPGTRDVATLLPNIQFAAAAGTRWDLVVLRRDWQPPGGTSSIVIIQGGATNDYQGWVGTAATDWNRRPGIMDDQPLYLQQVNGTNLGTRIDLRCWAGHGGLTAVSDDARTYLQRVGAEVLIGGVRWSYALGDNNVPGWVNDSPSILPPPTAPSGYSWAGTTGIDQRGGKKLVTVDVNVTRTGSNASISTEFSGLGAILPVAARASGLTVKYVPVSISGGTGNNILATAALNVESGVLSIRGQSAFTWTTGALFTVNLSYYI